MSTLDALVGQLERRYGSRAARRADELPHPGTPATIPTGLADLDAALPHGGLPRGALTEIVGARSAGATTLALGALAGAQLAGELARVPHRRHHRPPAAHPRPRAAGRRLGAAVPL